MSERMIELQRAKLGLPPAGSPPSAIGRSPGKGNLQSPKTAQPKTPEEVATAEVLAEDAQIQRLIHRLQRRDDLHPMTGATSGPTVPTALSRRMLQRQGVGYLDDTVAAAISASADRFLATVLQQAMACRDQRLKGAEMARDAARHRKRHMQHYEADTDDRKRRREDAEGARENSHMKHILAAEALKKGGTSKAAEEKTKKKKKKEEDPPATPNGTKPEDASSPPADDDDDESYDSIDEEEDYYQEQLGDVDLPQTGEDDEEDDTLVLKDLVRPLEAWDFHITGKEALEDNDANSKDDDLEDDEDEGAESTTGQMEDNGNDEGASVAGSEKGDAKSGDGESEPKPRPKASSSPTPKAS